MADGLKLTPTADELPGELTDELPDELTGELTGEENPRLQELVRMLVGWQSVVSLVSDSSLRDVWRRHIADSAQLVPYLPEVVGEGRPCLVDFGSGAGFPGLVVAILCPGWRVRLVEANGRKAAFLRAAVEAVGVDAVVHCARVESLSPQGADVVTARAVAPMERLLELAALHLGEGGSCLFHQGRRQRFRGEAVARAGGWRCCAYPSHTGEGAAILALSRPLNRPLNRP